MCAAACHLNVRFIHPPGPIQVAHLAANSLIQNGRITLHPPPDGHVINREIPLRHDLLQVTVGERISQVPPNAQEDYHVFEMPPPEQCWPSSGHDTPYQISPAAICNRTQ
jgi:hypothetical protein